MWGVICGLVAAGTLGITEQMLNMVAAEYGRRARGRIIDWQNVVDKHQAQSELEKLTVVNNFFNRNRFIPDQQHWNAADYWATPIEFLSTKGGDCEDFAIAKYVTLRALDIPEEKLRITYVKALRLNQAHMVLTYYDSPKAIPLVLDNIDKKIKPATKRLDLKPVYSFNGNGLWLAKMRGEGQKMGSADDLNMWRDLVSRLNRERDSK
ncbi:MAG: putative transglutaminase-like cysteine proteinase [Candidatus Azotimanducaceae bacterium]